LAAFRATETEEKAMRNNLVVILSVLLLVIGASAGTETVLWSFGGIGDPPYPQGYLISDDVGNLYGLTGGIDNEGTVFKLSPIGNGGWKEVVLYRFRPRGSGDGNAPQGGLVRDEDGNLYGVTWAGGAYDLGTVYQLSPNSSGTWTEILIHTFGGTGDGYNPVSGLTMDKRGNLYGTTNWGPNSWGTVYELSRDSGDRWTETILHSFIAQEDGANPYSGVILDKAGNLYGTTFVGGRYGAGTVYTVEHTKNGWTEKVLHSFNAADGREPLGGDLAFDDDGNLYGTTAYGGSNGNGTVWELMRSPTGHLSFHGEKVLYSFGLQGSGDGFFPYAGVKIGKHGNLYGVTPDGGQSSWGAVFELVKPKDGPWKDGWKEKILYSFTGGIDGGCTYGDLLRENGHLYGAGKCGGAYDGGVVFEVTCSK
jgi:uncharacterized repeat protein (TIGR03803 family)